VLQALRQRQKQGLPLSTHHGLYQAARRIFGTWNAALEAAGLASRRRQKWSKERVIDQLRRWDAEGRFDETTWSDDRTFVDAAIRLFGRWMAALVAAGVVAPGERRRRGTKWTREGIIETLQDRHVRGKEINYERDSRLIGAAIARFGSWHEAKRAAGVPVGRRKPKKRWTPDRVIQEIRARRTRGLTIVNVDRSDPSLTHAARRYFGTWHDALVAARVISPTPRRRQPQRWTRERVIDEVRSRYRAGKSLKGTSPNNRLLAGAAYRLFGSWPAALRAAKIPGVREPRKQWTHQRVLDEIQTRVRKGLPLRKVAVGQSLYSAALRRFGSWRSALEAAGVEPSDVLPERREWSRQSVIDEIQNRRRQGLSLAYGASHNGRLGEAGRRWFGSWGAALTAAGIPGRYGPRQRWSRRRILDELRTWRERGTIPTRRQVGAALQGAAQRHFGSWHAALIAAGIEPRKTA
jgi:hypothetical protein